ncbi:MAG: head-tail connector protein [Clostridium sp.]|uniref:head-tail connector protein n=1 Tax=Clostridium sp. TaxID=1506 RepID=UPI003F2D781A
MKVFDKDIESLTVKDIALYLRVEEDEETTQEIEMFYVAAVSFITSYLKHDLAYLKEQYDGVLPRELTIACLYLISNWYEQRTISGAKYTSAKSAPFTVTTILDLHRGWE